MTGKQAIEELKNVYGDAEDQHIMADEILCRLLSYIGYDDVVEEWKKVPKWYA